MGGRNVTIYFIVNVLLCYIIDTNYASYDNSSHYRTSNSIFVTFIINFKLTLVIIIIFYFIY